MATETHTGKLIFGDGEVVMDDGTVLAVAGSATPCATAAGEFAPWGDTQPVTVTGETGMVDNSPVLFVDSIQWAAQAAAPLMAPTASPAAPAPAAADAAAGTSSSSSTQKSKKSGRSRSKK